MDLEFREAQLSEAEVQHLQQVVDQETQSAATRAAAADFLTGRAKRWECLHDSRIVGGCVVSCRTGEVISIGVNSDHEGQGIGRKLLSLATDWLRSAGVQRIWVAAPSDPSRRAYGFFRALGWRPTGEPAEIGDEILEFPTQEDP